MHEEEHQGGGLLSGDYDAPAGGGMDPLDAVMAVAKGRAETEIADVREEPGDIMVETKVTVGGDAADDYGEFEWPDGYVADPGAMNRFIPLAKKLGLSKDKAQALAGLYVELDRERSRSQAEFIAKNNAEWLREVRNHPEFGGMNMQRTGENVVSLMRRYGSPLLLTQMRQMNIQNWPEMFYFLARLSQAMSEDCSPSGTSSAAGKSTAQLLFPDLK